MQSQITRSNMRFGFCSGQKTREQVFETTAVPDRLTSGQHALWLNINKRETG